MDLRRIGSDAGLAATSRRQTLTSRPTLARPANATNLLALRLDSPRSRASYAPANLCSSAEATDSPAFSHALRPSMPGCTRECSATPRVASPRREPPEETRDAARPHGAAPDHARRHSPPPLVSHSPVSSLFTLRWQEFAVFAHATCSLSVSEPYLALRVVYLAICAAFPNYATLQRP